MAAPELAGTPRADKYKIFFARSALYRRFRTTMKYFGRSRIKPYPISIRFEIYEKYFKETRGNLGRI